MLASSYLIESSSFLQVMRTCINAYMSSNFCQIAPWTTGSSAIERLKNQHITLSVEETARSTAWLTFRRLQQFVH